MYEVREDLVELSKAFFADESSELKWTYEFFFYKK